MTDRTPGDNWDDLAEWWKNEARTDPAYETDVHPMLRSLIQRRDGLALDLGCGEGQGMVEVGGDVVGMDLSLELAKVAKRAGATVVGEIPGLDMFRDSRFDLAYSVYLVDLIEDESLFFEQTARVVAAGGSLVIVMNHPAYTAPGSSPIADADGEVLWRWGSYFERGSSLEEAGGRRIRFFHRPLGTLLSVAGRYGWRLEQLEERALSADTVRRLPGYEGQDNIPRLLGARWTLDRRGSDGQ